MSGCPGRSLRHLSVAGHLSAGGLYSAQMVRTGAVIINVGITGCRTAALPHSGALGNLTLV